MGISMKLAGFIAGTKYEDIPQHVIEVQKKSVLDSIAITFGAGTLGDGCRQMVEMAEELAAGGRGEATVIGFGKKLPALWSAFANASMAHSLDFGDTHRKSTIHSNSSSFPAALAVAESMGGVSGRELLTALAVGSETAIRVALAADINTTDYGFYPPTIYSSYGATAAVAKLIGLTARQIVDAFSFNLCQSTCSSELVNNASTSVRSVREAFAARNAVVSCHMAKRGLSGFEKPLEGELGLYHMLLRDNCTPERAADGLGTYFEAADLTFKAWPCCFGTHSPITAMKLLMAQNNFTADDIEHIQVSIGAQNKILFEPLEQRRNPETSITGKFSIPFTLAVAVLYGNVDLYSFSDERMHDNRVRALASRIDYTYVDEWQRGRETYARVVVTAGGRTYEQMVTAPFGTPENPMSDEDFNLKFDSCAACAVRKLTDGQLQLIKETVNRLDSVEDIRTLTALL